MTDSAHQRRPMRLHLWGVRGSRPTHKLNLLGYGGNSTAIEFKIAEKDFYLILDGGSGLAQLGRRLGADAPKKDFRFLITHTHWDHILGFPFFAPIYNAGNRFTFYSSQTSKATFHELFFGLQRQGHLPVPVAEVKAKLAFESIQAGSSFPIGDDVTVSTYQLNHQGVTLGYRVDYHGSSAAVITDNAPIENGNYLGEGMHEKAAGDPAKFEQGFDRGLIEFLRDCHTVVFDTHFTEETLKPDWGHSTPQRAHAFCREAGVKRLVLFHHAPEDADRAVDLKVASLADERSRCAMEVVAAREGDEWICE